METISSFADWVRRRRRALDMTQAQLAALANSAVVTIKKIEQSTRRPSPEMAEAIADALAIAEPQRDAFLRMARHEYVDPRTIQPTDEAPFLTYEGAPVVFAEGETPRAFVGRQREITQLKTHLTAALNGNGRIIFIVGEAGCGKTTLMAEFARDALKMYPHLIVAGGNCEAYAGAENPYLPFRDVLSLLTCDVDTLGRTPLLTQDQMRRLWAMLPYVAQSLIDHGPDLLDVFISPARLHRRVMEHPLATDSCRAKLAALAAQHSRSGEAPQRKLFEQYIQTLRSLANRQPLLLLLDDLQWIDRASADLLLYLVRRLAGCPILLLCTFRPSEVSVPAPTSSSTEGATEAHALAPLLHELRRRYGDIEIDLGQATRGMDRAFVDALLDSEPNQLSERFRAALFQRTQGHPLFTVELLRDMQDRGALIHNEQGQWIESDVIDWDALPARVEAVISRRIERLPTLMQNALKIASVEGDTFTAECIAHILGVDGWEMVQQLSSIAGRQHRLVTSQGNQRLGSQLLSRYRFVHILFQNFLYQSLDDAERIYLHEAVGQALEQLAEDQREAMSVQLAHHFQQAHLPARAIEYLHKAGRQAMALSAHEAAITHLTRALTLLPAFPDSHDRARRELQLQTDLGVSYKTTRGFAAPEVETVYRRAQALCESVGDKLSWARVLWGLQSVHTVRGNMAAGREFSKEILNRAEEDPVLLVAGHFCVGADLYQAGQPASARFHFEQALDAYTVEQHETHIFLAGLDLGVFSQAHFAHMLCYLGYPDQAQKRADESVNLAQALGHTFSHASALSYRLMLYQLCGDWRSVQKAAEQTRQLCSEHDFRYYLAWTTFLQGWAMSKQGKLREGIVQMEQSLVDLQAMHTGLRLPHYLCLLAEAYGQAERTDDGLHFQAEALAQAHDQEQFLFESELHCVRAELLWKQQAPAEDVDACFRRAINVARQQQTKLTELRAVTRRARFHQGKDQFAEVRTELAGLVGWFGEGLQAVDLVSAQALLDATR